MVLRLRLALIITASVLTLVVAPAALARGGNYVFSGGTSYERAQVTKALAVSSFNWGIVPEQITVHIARGVDSEATVGNIWLDSDLLDSGTFSWGVVQHEYAHEVDFLLLTDADRAELQTRLHAKAWCRADVLGLQHADYGCERFASTLAWSYWQSPDNCMRPDSSTDESAALRPPAFRALLKGILPGDRSMASHR